MTAVLSRPETVNGLPPVVWRATRGGRRSPCGRQILHGIRGAHTLCGMYADGFEWAEPRASTPECSECTQIPDGHVTRMDFLSFITYRQLDYWVRRGYLRADNQSCGSGYRRTWPGRELRVARLAQELLLEGNHTVKGAIAKARAAVEREQRQP